MTATIKFRRGTASEWSVANPTPNAGEPCFETDTGVFKIGDGSTAYNSLPVVGQGAEDFIDLGDVPSAYTGDGGKFVKVKASEDGLEFVAGSGASVAWGDITGTLSGQTDLQTALDGKVDENSAITGATKTKITYDAKGLVTTGADATTADIADSLDKRYVTDAQLVVIGNTSGTNTGDQTITLTGDVTGSGTGSFSTTIANNAVTTAKVLDANITLAKIENIGSTSLIGRHSAGAGAPEQVGLDGGLEFQGANIRRSALTGDVTASAGSNTTTIASGVVSSTKLDSAVNASLALADSSLQSSDIGSTVQAYNANLTKKSFGIVIDGGGSAITTGIKGDIQIPFGMTITSATVLLDQTGSIVIDIWKDTYANYPATDADSITASAPPTVSSALKSVDSTLTGWTTTITAGDTIRFNVDSVATATRATLIIEGTLT